MMLTRQGGALFGKNVPVLNIADALSHFLDRPVLDRELE
jgi:hypothetical protein